MKHNETRHMLEYTYYFLEELVYTYYVHEVSFNFFRDVHGPARRHVMSYVESETLAFL
jgi:hypothetical protein